MNILSGTSFVEARMPGNWDFIAYLMIFLLQVMAWNSCPRVQIEGKLSYVRTIAFISTFGSLEVKAVGSLTKWAGNLSTTSLFSWSMMLTIFLSNLISIFWVQIPEVFSMASSRRIPSDGGKLQQTQTNNEITQTTTKWAICCVSPAGYTRSFSGDTVKVARCSRR